MYWKNPFLFTRFLFSVLPFEGMLRDDVAVQTSVSWDGDINILPESKWGCTLVIWLLFGKSRVWNVSCSLHTTRQHFHSFTSLLSRLLSSPSFPIPLHCSHVFAFFFQIMLQLWYQRCALRQMYIQQAVLHQFRCFHYPRKLSELWDYFFLKHLINTSGDNSVSVPYPCSYSVS